MKVEDLSDLALHRAVVHAETTLSQMVSHW